jgi:arsenate reductase
MSITIYHNPHCSKSRAALALLEEHGIKPAVVRYLETPPSVAELARIAALLDVSPRQMIRTGEQEYRDNGLDDPGLADDQLLQAMHDHPRLIERPIVVTGSAARIGRPPERVLEIIGN